MRRILGTLAAVLAVGWTCAAIESADAARRRPAKAASALSADAESGRRGKIQVQRRAATRRSPEVETLVLRMQRLTRGATYTLWGDDPRTEEARFARIGQQTITPQSRRAVVVRFSSTTGNLPFESSLDELAGQAIQVRDADGEIALAGIVPALPAR